MRGRVFVVKRQIVCIYLSDVCLQLLSRNGLVSSCCLSTKCLFLRVLSLGGVSSGGVCRRGVSTRLVRRRGRGLRAAVQKSRTVAQLQVGCDPDYRPQVSVDCSGTSRRVGF